MFQMVYPSEGDSLRSRTKVSYSLSRYRLDVCESQTVTTGCDWKHAHPDLDQKELDLTYVPCVGRFE